MNKELNFNLNQRLIIEKIEYQVTGSIEYSTPSDGSNWVEYCIREIDTGIIRWLSIDNLYEEYAIYNQCTYSNEFDQIEIERAGFYESDSGIAEVVRYSGKVDVSVGEQVKYVEYEDGTEEKIISIETWKDEIEYSKGWYLDWDEITPLGQSDLKKPAKSRAKFKKIWVFIPILLLGMAVVFFYFQSRKEPIKEFLSESSDFTYKTSITSDLNDRKKADVYETSLGIETVAKALIVVIEGDTEEVQAGEDGSVAILTKQEYCFIYEGTEGETLVQISSREYVRQSTNSLYHGSHYSHSYYRGFYYSRGYYNDRNKSKRSVDGFENYKGDTVASNPDDLYRNYSNSIRQNSVRSRTSAGGGISFGK